MPATGRYNISDVVDELLDSIPGPQDGESIVDYKARVNADVATIVSAIGMKISKVDVFVKNNSRHDLEDGEQIFIASRRRFVSSEDELSTED